MPPLSPPFNQDCIWPFWFCQLDKRTSVATYYQEDAEAASRAVCTAALCQSGDSVGKAQKDNCGELSGSRQSVISRCGARHAHIHKGNPPAIAILHEVKDGNLLSHLSFPRKRESTYSGRTHCAVVVQRKCHLNCSANLSPLVIKGFVRSAPLMMRTWLVSPTAEQAFDHDVRRWPVGPQLAAIGWCLRNRQELSLIVHG